MDISAQMIENMQLRVELLTNYLREVVSPDETALVRAMHEYAQALALVRAA